MYRDSFIRLIVSELWRKTANIYLLHRESKKGATLTMAITLSILHRLAKFFHCCKQQYISNKINIRLPIRP